MSVRRVNRQKTLRAFKVRLEEVQKKLRKEGYDYETVKALAEVAVHRQREEDDDLPLKAVATFSLDEIEADQACAAGNTDLLDLSEPQQDAAAAGNSWDPFNLAAGQANVSPPKPHAAAASHNPFATPPGAQAVNQAPSSLIDLDGPATASGPLPRKSIFHPLTSFLCPPPCYIPLPSHHRQICLPTPSLDSFVHSS